jgi:tetratricopeptide (TPR) repeat protein
MLALTSLAQKKPEEALDRFKRAVNVQPSSPVGYRALSEHYTRSGKLDDAMQTIEAGLKNSPTDFPLRQAKAGLLEKKGDFNGAIALYEELLKEQPGSMVLANNFASLVSDHRTDKESLEKAHAAAMALVKSDVPHFKDTLGWLYYLRGDYKSAQGLLEQAAKALPDNAVVRYHLGMTYKATGERDRAREELKKAAELDSGPLKSRIQAALQELSKAGAG